VTTNPSAALIKFPDGGAAPGHRLTAVAAGVKARLILTLLVSADTTDFDQLQPSLQALLDLLRRVGIDEKCPIQVAADAGYCSQANLELAQRLREQIDLLIDARRAPGRRTSGVFGHDDFIVSDDNVATCPAGTRMRGPKRHGDGRLEWTGIGCQECPLRAKCTKARARTITVHRELERLRGDMARRLATDEGQRRYRRRMATVEPVFSNLESVMNFRRASSRFEQTVVAEVLLKVLAHNISRLLAAKPLRRVYCLISDERILLLS